MPGSRWGAGSGGRDRGLLAGKRGANRFIGSEAGWDGLGCSALSLPWGLRLSQGARGEEAPAALGPRHPRTSPSPASGHAGFYCCFLGSFYIFSLLSSLSRSTVSGKRGPGASVAACGGPRPGGAHLWSRSSVVPSGSVREMRHGSGLGSAGVIAPAPKALGGSLIPVP